jgi:DNA-binding LacI/PurR family transcriptional regulator
MARSLMTQRTHLVALVMAQLRNPFFTEMIAAFNAEFSHRGYQTILLAVSPETRLDQVIERALPYQPDGVVLVTCSLTPDIAARCQARGLPVVVMNRPVDALAPHVWIRGEAVGAQVAQMLLAEGRKRVALLEFNPSEPLTGRSRSFMQELLRANGVAVTVDYGGFDYQSGRAAALRLLRSASPPDAIFCVNDLVALGVLDAARLDLGIAVPRDLSIVGFSDIEQASWSSHDLTTVRIPVDALVQSVVDAMLQRIEQPEAVVADVLVDCPVMIRGTTLARGIPKPPKG